MNSFSQIENGLYLPTRGLLVKWGASSDDLATGADHFSDWLPYGHDVRYGQLHWKNECCVPFQGDDKPWEGLNSGVVAYLKGSPLTIRSFGVFAGDSSYCKESVFQYALWMKNVSKQFGSPEVPTKDLGTGFHIVPPCLWRVGSISIFLSYVYAKGDPHLELNVSNSAFPL
jgi:hypothetical protein